MTDRIAIEQIETLDDMSAVVLHLEGGGEVVVSRANLMSLVTELLTPEEIRLVAEGAE